MDPRDAVLLVRALVDGPDGLAGALGARPDLDLGGLVPFVRHHRLAAFVAPGLAAPAAAARGGAAALAALAPDLATAAARADAVARQTAEAVDDLTAAGVEVLVLKGVVFGARYYGDPARRWQRDVDLLVREADVPEAMARLAALGYAPEEGRIGAGAVRRGFRRGPDALDLHWNLRRRSRRQTPAEAFFRAPTPVVVGGRTLRTLDDDLTLTFQLLALCGDLRRGGARARHLLDLHLALRVLEPGRDPEGFLRRREAQGLGPACANTLAVLLGAWPVAGDLPGVVAAVERRRPVLRDAAEALAVAFRPPDHPANEAWFQRAYPYDGWGAVARALTRDLGFTVRRALRPRFRVPPDPPGVPPPRPR